MSHPAEIADADESSRQHVQQESAQELVDGQRHQTLLAVVSGIAPAKSDHAIGKSDQPMVGNGHTMGVLAEITERVLGTAEWTFGINHPWGAEQGTEPGGEGLGILQHREGSVETEFVFRMQRSETVHELAPKHFFEHVHWQEELLLRVDPPRVARSQTAGGDYTMNMRMSTPTPTIP